MSNFCYLGRAGNSHFGLVATRESSRYLDGSCMKQEPPIERSEALRDAPVFGSSPFGGNPSQGARRMK